MININFKKLTILALGLTFFKVDAQMLRTSGPDIVDDNGNEVILLGLNTNNWLLQEGYMMEIHGAQWEIEEKIDGIVGEDNRHDFYDKWRANYYTKADIDSMAAWGFNSVRAPFHYKWISPLDTPGVIYERGLVELDSIISWCAQNNMWCILDMHAAPGGQGRNKEINDYNPDLPSLYESEANQDKLVEVWAAIADRYKDNPWVGGYDLINEPNEPDLSEELFAHVYQRTIEAIRAVDTNHIIFVEGQWFATSFSPQLRDTIKQNSNVAWSFHKYWNSNDDGAIGYLLQMRDEDQMPLWLGETGENSNQWFIELVQLCARHKIGWAWWGTKKIESISSIFEIPRPETWGPFANVANNGGFMDISDGVVALDEIAEASLVENNSFNMDMVYSLLGNPGGVATYPYADHTVPGEIMATDFDMGSVGEAMYDVDYANFGSGFYNSGWVYRNSGIDISADPDIQANGYHIGWNEPTEWVKYTINVETTGYYKVTVRAASDGDGSLIVSSPFGSSKTLNFSGTGGFSSYADFNAGRIYLEEGTDEIFVTVLESGFDFNKLTLEYDGTNSLDEDINHSVSVSPNPTSNIFNISANLPSDKYEVELFDLLGHSVYNSTISVGNSIFSENINMSDLGVEKGFYILNVRGENGINLIEKIQYK